MSETKSTVLKKVLSAAVGLEGPAMWQAIDQAADAIDKDPAHTTQTLEASAFAHLACFSGDGRQLLQAIKIFHTVGRYDLLQGLLATAKAFGETRAVLEIRRIGWMTGNADLEVPDFAKWFRSVGIRWFDVYEDEDEGTTYITQEDAEFLRILVAQEFPDQEEFWQSAVQTAEADASYPRFRLVLLKHLAEGRDPAMPTPPKKRADADRLFRKFAEENGIRILRQLASGLDGLRRCSNVYLGLDKDGIIKVYKEVLTHEEERVGAMLDLETDIFPLLDGIDSVPLRYGEIELPNGIRFLVRSCVYGQSLKDYAYPGQLLDKESVCAVIGGIAEILVSLHCRIGSEDIFYLDLRPNNVLVGENGPHLFDFNTSRREGDPQISNEVTAYILDPKFAPPEVTLRCKACAASDIFQLGLLFHQLLYGKMPFVTSDGLSHGDKHREQATLKFALANALLPYDHHPEKDFDDERLSIIRRMLDKNPKERPDANEVIDTLFEDGVPPKTFRLERRAAKNRKEGNTVIFPARMGIPHRGHIDYISRLLDLGFHVKTSLQRSYTVTDRDPIPKWIVMKMVARSLLERGFDPSSFSFMLTPFFEDDMQHRLHFSMMPEREDIVAAASSNPDVPNLFPGLPILDQKAVFGIQEQEFTDRSWGEILRASVKSGDLQTFRSYAASGVEEIMPFDELKRRYAETPVEFITGKVMVSVTSTDCTTRTARVRRYDLPEEVAAEMFGATIVKPFERDTFIRTADGCYLQLCYDCTTVTDGDEIIRFCVLPV